MSKKYVCVEKYTDAFSTIDVGQIVTVDHISSHGASGVWVDTSHGEMQIEAFNFCFEVKEQE